MKLFLNIGIPIRQCIGLRGGTEVVSTELRDRSIMMEYDICMSSNPESRQSIAKITKPETILRDGDSKDSHYI